MAKIVNIEIMGRPINIVIIILMIAIFWFALYAIKAAGGSLGPLSAVMNDTDDK